MTSQLHPQASSKPARVCRETVSRAVDALLKWIRSRTNKSSQLFSAEEEAQEGFLYLVLTLKKIPHGGRATNAYRIPLPHPLSSSSSSSSSSVCLLVDDRPKSPVSPAAARAALDALTLPFAVDVLPLSDLRSGCAPFESRRALAAAHDLFLADRRVVPVLPGLLGKPFYRKKKLPVPIDLGRKSWPDQLRQICGSTLLYLRSGTCSAIKVGRASQGRESIVENVMASVEAAVGYVPKKWKNVRSLHVKAAESLALPIYQAVPEPGGLDRIGVRKKERAEESTEEDELDVQKKIKMATENGDGCLKKRKSKGDKMKDRNAKGIKRSKVQHGND